MPAVAVDESVELHYAEEGSGPLVVLASYWSLHPSVFAGLTADLAADHRVVRYDDRGTGRSTPRGPYDLDTAAADLAAVIEAAGPSAIVVCAADGANRAVRVAASRPELVEAVVTVGGAPVGRSRFSQLEVLSSSDGVVDAVLAQVETDYRGTLRGLLGATNPQMSEDELRRRIDDQVEYSPHEQASERLRRWARDDPIEYAVATGDRLWVLVAETLAGGWFPAGREMAKVVERELPDAHIRQVSDGIVSRPNETADIVRAIAARRVPVAE